MTCTVCAESGVSSVALYRVYRWGFCKKHYADGVKAEAKNLAQRKAWSIRNSMTLGPTMTHRRISVSRERNNIQTAVADIHASDFQVTAKDRPIRVFGAPGA